MTKYSNILQRVQFYLDSKTQSVKFILTPNFVKMEAGDNSNANSQVKVTINKPKQVIHFSDGTEELIEDEKVNELQSVPETDHNVNPKNLSWGPWFSYYAWRSGSTALYIADYAGESLANFFGITTPKYQLEIDEYERLEEEKKKLEEESVGWVPSNVGGDVPLVMTEPLKINNTLEQV